MRKILLTAAVAIVAAGGAVPALADHATPEHDGYTSCYGAPPAQSSETINVSGFSIFTGTTVGYRTRDIYGVASVEGTNVRAGVFQPYWDTSLTGRSVWVDVGASAGTNGVTPCNKSQY